MLILHEKIKMVFNVVWMCFFQSNIIWVVIIKRHNPTNNSHSGRYDWWFIRLSCPTFHFCVRNIRPLIGRLSEMISFFKAANVGARTVVLTPDMKVINH